MPQSTTYTTLKGVTNIGDSLLMNQLEYNCTSFFDWGLLNVGGFFNVTINPNISGAYGGVFSRLRQSEDPNFVAGTIWESCRQNWVWESGLAYQYQPIQVSGVYVNGTFYPNSTTGQYAFNINYPLGRVIFNNPIAATSVVTCEYSYRYWNFTTAQVPWFREIQFDSFRVDDSQFLQYGSGAWSILSANRVQLPAVVVEAIPRRHFIPLQLGNGTRVRQDVLFHIFAEVPSDMKTMFDVITYQREKTINTFDINLLNSQTGWPIINGYLQPYPLTYPDLVAGVNTIGSPWNGGYYWHKTTFMEFYGSEAQATPPLYMCTVRGALETDMGEF